MVKRRLPLYGNWATGESGVKGYAGVQEVGRSVLPRPFDQAHLHRLVHDQAKERKKGGCFWCVDPEGFETSKEDKCRISCSGGWRATGCLNAKEAKRLDEV